jgi:hypothetical protein
VAEQDQRDGRGAGRGRGRPQDAGDAGGTRATVEGELALDDGSFGEADGVGTGIRTGGGTGGSGIGGVEEAF